jgi:hypothetical protein
MKMKIAMKAVYRKYQMDLNQTVVQEKSFNESINNSTMLQVQLSKKNWLSALPTFHNSYTSEKIYPILEKLETILESFKVDVNKNWKTAVKFMANNIHGSKQAALKKLDGSKLWSKTVKEEIVNAIDSTAVATNWNKKKNDLVFKGQENLENLTKFFADFNLVMRKLNVVDGKLMASEFQAKLPLNFQSMVYDAKMYNQNLEDSAEEVFKQLCFHLNNPAYKAQRTFPEKKKEFGKRFEKTEKTGDKPKKQEKVDKQHLKCDSCGRTGHIKEDCFSKCAICSKSGHNSKNCS